jgi:hypothetical protein
MSIGTHIRAEHAGDIAPREVRTKPGRLQTIRGQLSARHDHTGVVDQDIEPVMPSQDLLGQRAHPRQARQIRGHGLDPRERHPPADLVASHLTTRRSIAPPDWARVGVIG